MERGNASEGKKNQNPLGTFSIFVRKITFRFASTTYAAKPVNSKKKLPPKNIKHVCTLTNHSTGGRFPQGEMNMWNTKKYLAIAAIGTGLAVAAASPASACGGWGGGYGGLGGGVGGVRGGGGGRVGRRWRRSRVCAAVGV